MESSGSMFKDPQKNVLYIYIIISLSILLMVEKTEFVDVPIQVLKLQNSLSLLRHYHHLSLTSWNDALAHDWCNKVHIFQKVLLFQSAGVKNVGDDSNF